AAAARPAERTRRRPYLPLVRLDRRRRSQRRIPERAQDVDCEEVQRGTHRHEMIAAARSWARPGSTGGRIGCPLRHLIVAAPQLSWLGLSSAAEIEYAHAVDKLKRLQPC